ncbi:cyclic nucleotide-binding domain-containing protein [Nitrococcus mobilis]|uniref:Putative CRP-like regulatory protein n=1 Tax=Nitrococcus mobilis Nb-231 TaxID=314278 RepID=A4BQ20_9GAMM|nr:cyclic nucleotide-binding domain-containing protein [Nitrococcus mobilis]EAR22175.1 putative CRP-like regulatory protein [Nitrococcus mobilis Nb-231]
MKGIEQIVREHPFFQGLDEAFCDLVCTCARNVRFDSGEYLLHEGGLADTLYLIRHGRVALEIAVPGRSAVRFQTLGDDELVGISWLVPPYRWAYDARAIELTRAIVMDAGCLRNKCESDHDLGYEVIKRLMPILVGRLQATRMQILDVYGAPG